MKDAAYDYERLSGDGLRKSCPELYKTATRQIERRRLQVHRDEMTQSIAAGNATPVAPKSGKKGEQGEHKDKKGQTGKRRAVGKDQPAADALKGVCRFHLKGKRRAGTLVPPPPPCRFFAGTGGTSPWNGYPLPHSKPTASPAPAAAAQTRAQPQSSGEAQCSPAGTAPRRRGGSKSRNLAEVASGGQPSALAMPRTVAIRAGSINVDEDHNSRPVDDGRG